ncbi:MAG: signal peptidase II [Rhodospirillales bacterium]
MSGGNIPSRGFQRKAAGTGGLIAVTVIVLDQVSKWWMLTRVMDPPRVIEVTPFFNLVYAWNRGVSFGVFNSDAGWNVWVLPLVALAICVALAIWLARSANRITTTGLGMIIGGAIGNVIDRLRFGAVFDFLDVHAAGWHWPAFNLADSAISIGVVLLVLDSLFSSGEQRKSKKWQEDAGKRETTG